jgi:hypothetical protein
LYKGKSGQQQKSLEQEHGNAPLPHPCSPSEGNNMSEMLQQEQNVVDESEHLKRAQDLYGARLFMSETHEPAIVEEYIYTQEQTHLAEGLRFQQRKPRILRFEDGHIRGFGGEPMVDINATGRRAAQKAYLAGDADQQPVAIRRSHDVEISRAQDDLMRDGQIGSGFFHASPYQQEVSDEVAEKLGFWPKYRRSYMWFYRKISDTELECIDVSVDDSDLDTYKKLLGERGAPVQDEDQSHDIPGYTLPFNAENAAERDGLIDEIQARYNILHHDHEPQLGDDSHEAIDFLESNASEYIHQSVLLQRAIGESLKTGDMHQLVRLTAKRALLNLDCLDENERYDLHQFSNKNHVSQHDTATVSSLALVVRAQRYGIWHAVSEKARQPQVEERLVEDIRPAAAINNGFVAAIQQAQMIDIIFANTNQAAAQMKTMPGCAGGSSFMKQTQEAVAESIFGDAQGSSSQGEEDKYGSLDFTCINGHPNRRPRNQMISRCRVASCINSVGCRPESKMKTDKRRATEKLIEIIQASLEPKVDSNEKLHTPVKVQKLSVAA